MDNTEKLAPYGTQDEEKQNKNTTQHANKHKQDTTPPTTNRRL